MAKIYATDNYGRRYVLAEVCNTCYAKEIENGMHEDQIAAEFDGNGEDRYSFGVYAGHYCDAHWRVSGYKGSTPETADEEFDPDFAGERMEDDY